MPQNPNAKRGELVALCNGLAGDDQPDPCSILSWITSGHKALFYELFFGGIVLAEYDISPCKHHIHYVIEAMPRIKNVTVLVNAQFWFALWSTQT